VGKCTPEEGGGGDRYVVGDSALRVLRQDMEIIDPYFNGGGISFAILCTYKHCPVLVITLHISYFSLSWIDMNIFDTTRLIGLF
jgi:hypothetical protein